MGLETSVVVWTHLKFMILELSTTRLFVLLPSTRDIGKKICKILLIRTTLEICYLEYGPCNMLGEDETNVVYVKDLSTLGLEDITGIYYPVSHILVLEDPMR